MTLANETDLLMVFDDSSYQFHGGRFWTSPCNVAANSESAFSVCNKFFGVGVEGQVTYHLTGQGVSTKIVISYRNNFFGDTLLSARFEEEGGARDTTLNVEGAEAKICISCVPGSEARITIYYQKEKAKPSQLTVASE